MKCQNLFSGKNKTKITVCRLLKILPRVLSVKRVLDRTQNATYESLMISSKGQITHKINEQGCLL